VVAQNAYDGQTALVALQELVLEGPEEILALMLYERKPQDHEADPRVFV
jgi:hypothetical protein